jgi:hypothetical protein
MSPDAEADPDGAPDSSIGEVAQPAEICGCAPGHRDEIAPAPSAADAQTDHPEPTPGGEGCEAARDLKLVAILHPDGSGYRAQLAAGADGCDPELGMAQVPDLASALAALNELSAAAEARWRLQRRYPPAPRPAPTPRQRSSTPAASSRVDVGEPSSSPTGARSEQTMTNATESDQLSLFG